MIQKVIPVADVNYPVDDSDAPTIFNTITPIRAIPTTVAPDGILRPLAVASIPEPVIDLSQPSLVSTMSRPEGISDSAWATMQSQGFSKISAQQMLAQKSAEENLANIAISKAASEAAAKSATDAMTSLQRATELSKAMQNVTASAAAEIVTQIMRANNNAQVASELPEATDADRNAATAANIITTQAIADAMVKQTLESKENAYHAEQTATYLKQVADATQQPEDNANASEALQRLKDANDKLMADAKLANESIVAANVTLSQAQSDVAALALSVSLSPTTVEVTSPVAVKKVNWFGRLVNYIYSNLYKK